MIPTAPAVACPACYRSLPPDTWNVSYETYCPNCRSPVTAVAFPALVRDAAVPVPFADAAVEGSEATCFYHARRKAAVPCDQCGRFLCSLCHVDFLGQSWCPACIDLRRRQGTLAALDKRRVLYDNIALLLVLWPFPLFVFWPLILVSAPAALFVIARYWRAQPPLIPRTKARFIIAGALAILELCAIGYVFLNIAAAFRHRLA